MPRPRPCLVCSHPRHAALLKVLDSQPLRTLERQYKISRSVLGRHRRVGCPGTPPPEAAQSQTDEPARVVELLEEIKTLLEHLVRERRREERPSPAVPVPNWNQL